MTVDVVLLRSRSPGVSLEDDDHEEEGRCNTWCPRASPTPSHRHPVGGSRPQTSQSPVN